MTLDEGARDALAADLDRVEELAVEARAALADQRGGSMHVRTSPAAEEIGPLLRRALTTGDRGVIVGTYAEVVVGYALVRSRALRDGACLGVVDELYVEPDARQVGVGAALLTAALGWCEEEGCIGLDAVALPGDRATKNFFEGFGLVARAIVAHRPLGGGAP